MARRAPFGLLALLLAGGCAYGPGFTHGPPYGGDLVREHHDAFPAASEREARFARIRHFGSQRRCEAHLSGLGEVVRLSAYEVVAHRTIAYEGRPVIEEHHCARETLQVRAWYEQAHEPEAAHH
jgi:hypothetical protein